MTRLGRYFQEYDGFHRHPVNKALHRVGVPLIVFSVLGLASQLVFLRWEGGLLQLDAGVVLVAVVVVWSMLKDWRVGLSFAPVALGIYFASRALGSPWVHLAIFLAGWALQLFGHVRYEKKAPALTRNLEHLLVAPMWIFAWLTGQRERDPVTS